MPASSADNIQLLEDAVKASLSFESGGLDQKLSASAKRALFERIQFRQARYKYKLATENLRSKYILLTLLNPTQQLQPSTRKVGGNEVTKGFEMNDEKSDGIPSPKVVFYPSDKLNLKWQQVQHIGAGLQNLGNTCFLNSTLQCLTYTAPLVNYLLSGEHTNKCKLAGFCMLCELQRHIRRALYKGGEAIKPQCMLQKLKAIAKHMHWGRQEDAHEFLRYVIDAMHNSCLNGYIKKQLDPSSLETTVVNRIFGGYHRSQVQCLKCKETSNTYDPFMDISLDIKNVTSLEKALDRFVQPETLENDNAYLCLRCNIKVPALKRFSIHRPPNIATFQLKRFDYNRFHGGKIVKHIPFPERLDLRPYMSQRQGPPVNYSLYAVLVHQGPTCNSGHYFCFVRNSNNMWYLMDDSRVRQVSTSFVLSQQAYLLFYTRLLLTVNNVTNKVNNVNSQNLLRNVLIQETPKTNGTILNTSEVLSLSTTKKLTNPVETFHHAKLETNRTFLSNPVKAENGPSHPLPINRDRISFDVKSKNLQDGDKPRIVMHIKHGKVYNSIQQPSVFSKKNIESKTEAKLVRKELVPYGRGEDSDSSDQENKSSLSNVTAKKVSPERIISSPTKLCVKTADNHIFENCKTSDYNLWNKKVSGALVNSQSKRSNESLILTLPTNCIKVKATSSWQITDPSPISPSLGSNSSNASVNSTTDWTVLDKDGTPHVPLLPEGQYPGWKITPIEDRNLSKCFENNGENNDSISERPVSNIEGSSHSTHKTTDSPKDIKKNIAQYEKASERDIGHFILKRTKLDSDCPESRLPHSSESSKPKEMFRVHLKTFSAPLTIDVCKDETQECEKDSQEWSKSSKHDDLGNYWEERRKSEHSKSSRENCDSKDECRISRESDLCSEKNYLINGHKSEESFYSSKKHKKHKKKKRRSSFPKSCSTSLEINSNTKHKKKKHKHKKDKERHSEKEHKHKQYSDSGYECMDKSIESSSESSFELEWVEKTKETVEQEKQSDQEVPVVTWDHYLKHSCKPTDPVATVVWDGTNSSGVVDELIKYAGKTCGNAVSSWDGGTSVLDQELELKKDTKRNHSEDYDEEYDKGKVKKLKVFKPKSHGSDVNPFQKLQNQRNEQNVLKLSYGQDC